jgi:superfamily II DNA or RNA helicase
MNIIQVDNNYSILSSENQKLKDLLWKSLRCRAMNYFHNPRYKMKLWDGYDDFFKKESGKFLTGLLPEVRLALKHLSLDYEIIDARQPFNFTVNEIDNTWLDNKPILRDYQVDYVNQVIRNNRGVISAVPGSGKTLVMKAIIKALPPKTMTLVLANRTSLVEQNYDEIKSLGIDWVGRLYGKKKEPNYITCATSQSAKLLKPLLPKVKVLFVDEIHEMMSKGPKQIYNALKNCSIRVAMSGTPFKFDGKDETQKYEVKGWFGPLFLTKSTEDGKLTTEDLIDQGILSSTDCTFFRVTQPKLPYEIYLDAVTKGIAENNHFHGMVVNLIKRLSGRTLIIVDRIEHGDRLHDMIPGALWVRGKDSIETRKEIIEKLKTDQDDLVAIATSGIFNTGINVFCHNLVNAAGGKADHQIIQRLGRGLRRAEDKEHLKYYDFLFEINDYLEKHSRKRIQILEKQGHTVEIKDYGI